MYSRVKFMLPMVLPCKTPTSRKRGQVTLGCYHTLSSIIIGNHERFSYSTSSLGTKLILPTIIIQLDALVFFGASFPFRFRVWLALRDY